jgi:hypothetical protein
MTREEALAMPKEQLLKMIKEQYERDFPNLVQVELVFNNGTRSAVGNKTCIDVVKKSLMDELDRQIAEVESK